ncbi:sigma 54-interacting transcriptional regulator [Clostridium sp. Cult2]|uniref:sigma 54-interacting transcriptional regulator n=1 Tax=Clostridium sp. Cult2 TaxID=2079003 RepID=UPI001F0069EA|nr:sigma 54-interacting transcriptional regulator [Clostridium sp. Cult2]
MNPKILVVSIYPELTEMFEEISKELGIAISIYKGGIMKDGHLYAKKMENKFDVIISQGGTLEAIKEVVSIPVVSVEVTTGDILKALLEAKEKYNKKIILFCYRSEKLNQLQDLKSILNVDFEVVNYGNKQEFVEQTENIFSKNQFALVGMGSCILETSRGKKIDSVIIKSSRNAVKQAIIDAQNICDLSKREKERAERLNTIIDYSSEGIVAIDKNGVITTFNPVAEEIFELEADFVLGKNISDLRHLRDLNLVYGDGNYKLEEIIKINNIELILNRIPVMVEGEESGLIITLQEVSKLQSLERTVRNKLYNKGLIAKHTFSDILGVSKAIKETINNAIRFGKTSTTILIQGETGSGKELFAQSIHNISDRKDKPFVAVNCAALPDNLLESELFGYEEGAFTGAKKGGKPGLFELAHGGTIFLDEIGEIPLSFQSRLLRVLQEKEVLRIGGDHIVKVDVRVVAATNIDLYKMVNERKFRRDLYFRLNILNLRIPPIRQRQDDIPVLVNEFIRKMNRKHNRKIKGLEPKAMELLMEYSWPGNVREIENFVERMVILSDYEIVEKSFIKNIFDQSFSEESEIEKIDNNNDIIKVKLDTLNNMELQIINELNNRLDDNKTLLAEKLDISRTTLWKKMKELEEIH